MDITQELREHVRAAMDAEIRQAAAQGYQMPEQIAQMVAENKDRALKGLTGQAAAEHRRLWFAASGIKPVFG